MIEQEQRTAVVAAARKWLLTPYHHQGRVMGAGVDCATLIIEAYAAAGVIKNIFPDYSAEWHLHKSEELYLQHVESYAKQVDEPDIADLIVWRWGRTFSHGAIYIGNGEVIHSYIGIGCVIASMRDNIFEGRPKKCFTVWGK